MTLRTLAGSSVAPSAPQYLQRWRFKHPKPWDFFDTFNSVGGRNEDRGLAPMPVRLTITRTDGTTEEQEIPVDTWLAGAKRAEVLVVGRLGVAVVEIDAAQVFPDLDRSNNRWAVPPQR